MRRRLIQIPALILMMLLIGGDLAEAKRSSGGKRSSRAVVKKGARAKGSRAKVGRARGGRGRAEKIARGRRGRRGRLARSSRHRRYAAYASSADAPRPSSNNIPTERVSEIQNALIKLGYLEEGPSGQYDDNTVAAMKQFQTDNKLPASGYPSAHALKKLGVAKRSSDGYAVPVGSVSEKEKKPPQHNQEN